MSELKVGERVLNVNYLKYIGDTQSWLKINMQPFETVKGIDECMPWDKLVNCFSVYHSDIKGLARVPMHKNKLFSVDTGLDMDRHLDRFLGVRSHRKDIESLVKLSVENNTNKGNEYALKRIQAAEVEIAKLKKSIESHSKFCSECGDHIIKELYKLGE